MKCITFHSRVRPGSASVHNGMNRLITLALLFGVTMCHPKNIEPTGAQLNPADEGTEDWAPILPPVPVRTDCSPEKIAEVLEPVNTNIATVINCNLTLEPEDVITKRVIFQGEVSSGTTLNCNNGTIDPSNNISSNLDAIEIRSLVTNAGWEPVHDVSVQNCTIRGSVRIYGMGKNSGDSDLTESSRTFEHVNVTRNNAPYSIDLDNVTIIGRGRIPLYFGPGVYYSNLTNSKIEGNSTSVMMYLDAETYGNTIYQTIFNATYAGREVIALDGSSYNTIEDNRILKAPLGGIYLYRNCGENGTIRHATPSYNEIINNEIRCLYNIFDIYAAIYLGSRDGGRGYCDDDVGYPYGSSVSDQDHARYNVVTGNELHGCSIKTGNKTNHSNIVD